MERILNAFKNLYKGENICKTHWMTAALFIFPCLAASIVQYIDKDTPQLIIPLAAIAGVFLILSIIPLFTISGFYFKFLKKRLTEEQGLPNLDLDCLKIGIKSFPVTLAWTLYIGIPIAIYIAIVLFGSIGGIVATKANPLAAVSVVFLMIGLILLLFIPIFIINPFISLLYMKFAETFEYSTELFNPITIFRYMKKAFKETMLVALKFIVVSIVTSFAGQIVVFICVIFLFVFGFIFALFTPENANPMVAPGFIITVIAGSTIAGVISAYISWITSLAFADNLEYVYRDIIRTLDQEEAKNNENTKIETDLSQNEE